MFVQLRSSSIKLILIIKDQVIYGYKINQINLIQTEQFFAQNKHNYFNEELYFVQVIPSFFIS